MDFILCDLTETLSTLEVSFKCLKIISIFHFTC